MVRSRLNQLGRNLNLKMQVLMTLSSQLPLQKQRELLIARQIADKETLGDIVLLAYPVEMKTEQELALEEKMNDLQKQVRALQSSAMTCS